MNRTAGEYRIYPVDEQTITTWLGRHPDYPHPIQYADKLVIAVVRHPLHDGTSSIVIQEIKAEIDRMCSPGRARLSSRTGCTIPFQKMSDKLVTCLSNVIRKNSDGGLFSHEGGGKSSVFPSIVVETGFSDTGKQSRRDIRLWLDCSDYSVFGTQ